MSELWKISLEIGNFIKQYKHLDFFYLEPRGIAELF